ncbi:hypothetical protein [Maribacter sp. 1_MG-2023]|uniref:hypothetical protein n=1 Tax=Maribacter sp. 1_MG-2023 TaxID=3062677 RepID=UPI0026E417EB|nr:hypothetical protein [Maribacter sp. 1_MG-2023]MDO6470966.1 hypothetical protein [Maribacter sp. 1_MG-2023]
MSDYTFSHQLNIWLHIISGCLAMIMAIIAMISSKGKTIHKKSGLLFVYLIAVVIATGLIGILIFKVNTFLLVLTLLSGYQAFSGYRILGNKKSLPKLLDIIVAVITLGAGIYFMYYIETIGFIWAPGIIYSTVAALFLIITYDFLRYLLPKNKYKNRWLYEHIYKMVASFTALLAAFIGTVLPEYKPYSQFLPSIFGTLLAIGFIIFFWRKNKIKKI